MTWNEIRNKPLIRYAFQWDGTEGQLEKHFTPEQRKRYNIRVMRSTKEAFVMLSTLHGPSHTSPGDWIIRAEWATGVEVYSVKNHVFKKAYELTGNTIDHEQL